MPITTIEELSSYLHSAGIPFATLAELSGGTANYVYRITLPNGSTSVLKHAEPFVKSNHLIPFPSERMTFEAHAIQTIQPLLESAADFKKGDHCIVAPPKLLSYDKEQQVMITSDGGDKNLKDAYTDVGLDVPHVGHALGMWGAQLHNATKAAAEGISEKVRHQFNNPIAKAIYRFSYQNLAGALQEYGFDPSLGERVNEEFGALLQTDDECVCHGDFWTGNVLISPANSDLKLTIVDWEMVRNGTGATDVGQFAAEAWLLDRFRGGKGLTRAFMKGYVEGRGGKLERAFVKRALIQFGTHLAFWPTRVEWASREETREVVKFGVEILMRAVDEGDFSGLNDDILGILLEATQP